MPRKTNQTFLGLPVFLAPGPGNRLQVESIENKKQMYYGVQSCPTRDVMDIEVLQERVIDEQRAAMSFKLTRILVGEDLLNLISEYFRKPLELGPELTTGEETK